MYLYIKESRLETGLLYILLGILQTDAGSSADIINMYNLSFSIFRSKLQKNVFTIYQATQQYS